MSHSRNSRYLWLWNLRGKDSVDFLDLSSEMGSSNSVLTTWTRNCNKFSFNWLSKRSKKNMQMKELSGSTSISLTIRSVVIWLSWRWVVCDLHFQQSQRPPGLLALLDDTCNFPKGTDEKFLAKSIESFSQHAHYVGNQVAGEFLIRHYAGDVRLHPGSHSFL